MRDTYPGEQLTIFDNRGICQHSGLCTGRLATVFRAGAEPFVAPSGGRMDEIIRAVRDCPSGALSYAIDGTEAREQVDQGGARAPAIEVTKDGPYRITGALSLIGADGTPEPRAQGASAEHYALCRCGHSQNKPFCSGMHWYVEFRDPPGGTEPTLFEWAGGLSSLARMSRLLYEKHVPADSLLAPLFADMPPDQPGRLAAWLAEALGGPAGPAAIFRPPLACPPARSLRSSGPDGWPWPAPRPTRRRCQPTRPSVPRSHLPRVGIAGRAGAVAVRRGLTACGGAPLGMGSRRAAGGHPRGRPGRHLPGAATRTRPAGELRRPHQAAVPPTGPAVDELRVRPVVR
jgi:uncharacterized Fe-S cluster protein YjdI/CDGSH-type Zn-finger protein